MVGFVIQRPLEATVLTASLTHGAATAPEGKAQLEALLFFLGQCRAIGDMVVCLAILNLGSVSGTDPFSPGDCMWRRPKLVSLDFLFGRRSEIMRYVGDRGGIGQESTGLAELVDACSHTLCTTCFKIKYVTIFHHTCSFARISTSHCY